MHRFRNRLRALWRRRQLDRDLEDELAFHLAMQTESGRDPRAVRRQFGNPTALKESCRELWTFAALETWWQDLRYAARTLAHSPTVTWAAVVALALGIGANTTVFTVIHSALSFDMGVDHIERLVIFTPGRALERSSPAPPFPGFLDLRDRIHSVTHLAAYRMTLVNVSDRHGLPDVYSAVQMTAGGWGLVNRKPALGRVFATADEAPDAAPGLVLSDRVWRTRYGADPSILGKVVRVDEAPRTVIGVMPAGMQFPEDTDLWTLLTPRDLASAPGQRAPMVFGRLADGVSLATARGEADAVVKRLVPVSQNVRGPIVEVRPFLEMIGVYAGRVVLIAVLCAVTFVLLIVCADVANLLLARAAARAREISIRIAIGAGRARIVRQLLVESTLLALGGGSGGWLVALAGLRWFDRLTASHRRPSWIDFSMNTNAFLYLAAISVAAGILFGLAPALQLARVDVNSGIKDGGRGAEGGMRGRRISNLLVVVQMALCVILLAGAGLMIRSSVKLYNAPLALNPDHVLTMRISLPELKYPSAEDRTTFYATLKAKLGALPGVESVSLTSHPPVSGALIVRGELDGAANREPNDAPAWQAVLADADYFRTLEIRLRRGRPFTAQDEAGAPATVIVNESFAARYWRGEDPLGKRLRLAAAGAAQVWLTVVGVAPDNPQNFQNPLQHDALLYLPYSAQPRQPAYFLARVAVPPDTLEQAFRRAVQNLDDNLPAQEVSSVEERISRQRLNVTAFGMLFTIFAVIALVLACIGLYAVIAHAVSRRTQEIGIRVALGATQHQIATLVLAQGMRQVAIGLAVGLPLAFVVTRALRGALFGVSPGDPVTFGGVIAVLLVAGVLGCGIPAARALRIDPLSALRSE